MFFIRYYRCLNNFSFVFIISFLLFQCNHISAQNIPPFTCISYDSTLTGYFFLANLKFSNSPPGNVTNNIIVDPKGNLIYYKPFPANNLVVDFKIQPDGRITYFNENKFYILDSTFNTIDSVRCIGYATDAHDLQILSNGNYLLLGTEYVAMDLSNYFYFNHNGSPGSDSAAVQCGVIQMLDSNKNVLFEWHAKDYFQFDDAYAYFLDNPDDVDWTHCNAVELDHDGNILLSSRHLNEITKIDITSGNIIWRMGGKHNQFTFINDSLIFRGQHDIRRIANGNITLFDNGKFFNSHAARGIEYSLDEVNKTASLVWSYIYAANVSSFATGNVQRLLDGKTLVNFGIRTNSTICFTLLDSSDNKLFELFFPDSSATYRAFYYPTLPFNLNRPELMCYHNGNNFYLKTISNFNSYLWSTGDTTSSIQITATGSYFVFITYGDGFIKSEIFDVTNVNDPCGITSVNENRNQGKNFLLYPNPVKESLTLFSDFDLQKKRAMVKIYNCLGELILQSEIQSGLFQINFNMENLSEGIYFLKIEAESTVLFKDKFVIIH